MRRREFIAGLGGAAAWPLVARAQQADRVRHVGALMNGDPGDAVGARNGAYTLAVRDTGPGIDPADQTKIFEEFQQADDTTTKKKGGTGLGLSIARRIVAMHGGRIWVESEIGAGSTFFLEVPVDVEQQVGNA